MSTNVKKSLETDIDAFILRNHIMCSKLTLYYPLEDEVNIDTVQELIDRYVANGFLMKLKLIENKQYIQIRFDV